MVFLLSRFILKQENNNMILNIFSMYQSMQNIDSKCLYFYIKISLQIAVQQNTNTINELGLVTKRICSVVRILKFKQDCSEKNVFCFCCVIFCKSAY